MLLSAATGPGAGLACFDMANAFPTISRKYLWLVLASYGFSRRIIRFVKKLYMNNRHSVLGKLHVNFFIDVNSGLRQGCPLSALLFSLCLAPLVHKLNTMIPKPLGIVETYLDDIAIVFPSLHLYLHKVLVLFEFFSRIPHLCLSLTKCVLVLLFDVDLVRFKSDCGQLSRYAKTFAVEASTRYLSPFPGNGGPDRSWEHPIMRYHQAVDTIVRQGLCTATAIYTYKAKAITTMGYIAGFLLSPLLVHAKLKLTPFKSCFRLLGGL